MFYLSQNSFCINHIYDHKQNNPEEDQVTLLRKGPSFCPIPKDINWQEVYDDYEVFKTRLRTAAYLIDKPTDTTFNSSNVSCFPKIIKPRNCVVPKSKYPGIELFLKGNGNKNFYCLI